MRASLFLNFSDTERMPPPSLRQLLQPERDRIKNSPRGHAVWSAMAAIPTPAAQVHVKNLLDDPHLYAAGLFDSRLLEAQARVDGLNEIAVRAVYDWAQPLQTLETNQQLCICFELGQGVSHADIASRYVLPLAQVELMSQWFERCTLSNRLSFGAWVAKYWLPLALGTAALLYMCGH